MSINQTLTPNTKPKWHSSQLVSSPNHTTEAYHYYNHYLHQANSLICLYTYRKLSLLLLIILIHTNVHPQTLTLRFQTSLMAI